MTNKFILPLCAALVMAPMTGSFAATTDLRNAVHNTHGAVAVNTFNNCVRSNFAGAVDECAPPVAKQVVQPAPRAVIAKEERTVYFDFNKFTLTEAAVKTLNSLAAKLKSDDQVREAKIVGTADRIGTPSYNEKLSKRRADNVRRYLVSQGFIKGRVAETSWLGESEPVTNCPDNLNREELIACLQQDRRVEVQIEYQQ